jgi:hypothetical protein
MTIPLIAALPSNMFKWRKGKGTASLADVHMGRFPQSFQIISERTGKICLFVIDREVMEENEFFDGEATAYMSGEVRVQIWS